MYGKDLFGRLDGLLLSTRGKSLSLIPYICTKLINAADQFIPFLIDLHRQGKFPIEKISKKYKVDQFKEAIHAM